MLPTSLSGQCKLTCGDSTAYNFTGSHETIYNQFVAPLQNFTITPTKVAAVA